MTDVSELVVGGFYWVVPAIDPDTDEEWERHMQPARFAGMVDGRPVWHVLNVQGPSDWAMIYVGARIEAMIKE